MSNVYDGHLDEFSVLAFGQNNPATVQFLQNRYQEVANFGNVLTDFGKQFYQASQRVFEQATGSDAMRFASSVLRKVGNLFQSPEIRSLFDITDVQQAPGHMVPYLMAQPQLLAMFRDQRVEGYSSFTDSHPTVTGWDHPLYRQVTNGLIRDDDEHDFVISFHYDDEIDNDGRPALSPDQKLDVASAWDIIAGTLNSKASNRADPTSDSGNTL